MAAIAPWLGVAMTFFAFGAIVGAWMHKTGRW